MPQDVRISPDGTAFYVADMMANGVWKVDGDRLAVTGFIRTGKGAHGLYPSRDAQVPLRQQPRRGLGLGAQLRDAAGRRRSGGCPAAGAPTWAASRPTARCSG